MCCFLASFWDLFGLFVCLQSAAQDEERWHFGSGLGNVAFICENRVLNVANFLDEIVRITRRRCLRLMLPLSPNNTRLALKSGCRHSLFPILGVALFAVAVRAATGLLLVPLWAVNNHVFQYVAAQVLRLLHSLLAEIIALHSH